MYIKIKRVPGIKYFYAKFLWIISFSNDLSISPCKSFVEKLAAQRLVLLNFSSIIKLFFPIYFYFPINFKLSSLLSTIDRFRTLNPNKPFSSLLATQLPPISL